MENANLLIKDFLAIYGVANDKIIVSPSSSGGNGVFLTSDVKQNENVLKIPLEIIIWSNCFRTFVEWSSKFNVKQYQSLLLLVELCGIVIWMWTLSQEKEF